MKKLFIHLLFATCSLGLTAVQPYDSIQELPFDEQGWFGNGPQLEKIINETNPKTIIEIGAWLGSSTRFLAQKSSAKTKVYTVDTWNGSPNEGVHLQDPRLPYLYQLFLSNVKHAGLTDKIIPIRMSSLEANAALNVKADLIYIDASHDTNSVIDDILHWQSHLNPDGVMCGDDWLWDSVRIAVEHCAPILGKKIYSEHNFWRFYD